MAQNNANAQAPAAFDPVENRLLRSVVSDEESKCPKFSGPADTHSILRFASDGLEWSRTTSLTDAQATGLIVRRIRAIDPGFNAPQGQQTVERALKKLLKKHDLKSTQKLGLIKQGPDDLATYARKLLAFGRLVRADPNGRELWDYFWGGARMSPAKQALGFWKDQHDHEDWWNDPDQLVRRLEDRVRKLNADTPATASFNLEDFSEPVEGETTAFWTNASRSSSSSHSAWHVPSTRDVAHELDKLKKESTSHFQQLNELKNQVDSMKGGMDQLSQELKAGFGRLFADTSASQRAFDFLHGQLQAYQSGSSPMQQDNGGSWSVPQSPNSFSNFNNQYRPPNNHQGNGFRRHNNYRGNHNHGNFRGGPQNFNRGTRGGQQFNDAGGSNFQGGSSSPAPHPFETASKRAKVTDGSLPPNGHQGN